MRENILYIVGEAGEPMKKSEHRGQGDGGSGKAVERHGATSSTKEGRELTSWKQGNAIM